jgi:outer membrane lipoprotein-sorting protein
MKKYQLLIVGLLFCSATGLAQYQTAGEEQKKEIIGKITQTSDNINTMQCDFTQVKELSFMNDKITSEGKMLFKKPNMVRWEYTKPYQYIFSMDGKNARMIADNKVTTIPAKQSKLIDELSKVMVSAVSGKDLIGSSDFDTELLVGSSDYKVVLTPKKKEVKDLFSSILLYVGKSDNRVRTIELTEKGGDKTSIALKNVQTNTIINDEIFSR